jgi:hypothetical protein
MGMNSKEYLQGIVHNIVLFMSEFNVERNKAENKIAVFFIV